MTKLTKFIMQEKVQDGYSVAYAVEKLAQLQRCSQESILNEALKNAEFAQDLLRFASRLKGN